MSLRPVLLVLCAAAGAIALSPLIGASGIARAQGPQDGPDESWLAQMPPGDDADEPGPPRRDGFDRPLGDEAVRAMRERLEQLRRVQEQLRDLATESMPNQDTLRRLARQMDEALSPPAQRFREGVRERWRDFMARRNAPADRRGGDRMPRQMRPMAEADARAGRANVHAEFVNDMQRLAANPIQALIVAVRGIVDASKDNPQQGITALQRLLDQEQPLPARTVIRLGLRDLYEMAGDRQAAIDQLAAVVRENAEAMKEHQPRRQPPPPQR